MIFYPYKCPLPLVVVLQGHAFLFYSKVEKGNKMNNVTKTFNIESPLEFVFNEQTTAVTLDVVKTGFRGNTSTMVIGEMNTGSPAFKDWSKRLTCGEKLPRGKYFRREEIIRTILKAPKTTIHYTSIHV
jgi:hypothetical protein